MKKTHNMKYCTYISSHPSGMYYIGKGITANILANKYKGSGVRFNVALRNPTYAWDTWTTEVLQTFETEDEAYAAEAELVTNEQLMDPFCMNMTLGGRKGAHRNHSTLLRQMKSAEKKVRTTEQKLAKAARAAKQREKQRQKELQAKHNIKELKKKLEEK